MIPVLFISLLFSFACQNVKYTPQISIVDTEEEINVGIFKALKLTLESKEGNPYRSKAVLKVQCDSQDVTMASPVYIDTHKSFEYIVYVGVSKDVEIEESENITLKFIFENEVNEDGEKFDDSDDFDSGSITLTLTEEKLPLFITTAYPYLPVGSWIIYNIMENILNVDPIKLTLKSYIGDGISFESPTLPPFTGIRSFVDESFSGKIMADENARTGPRVIDIMLEENSPFYLPEPQITVEVILGGIAEIPEYEQKEMMKSIEVIDIGDINRISLQFKVLSFPTMLTCLCQQSELEFPEDDDDIRYFLLNEEEEQNQHKKYFQRFITTQLFQTIFFDDMSRLGRFKIKCLLDSTSINDRKTFSFTAGNFQGADFKTPLMKEENAPIFPNCLTYNFANEIQSGDVENINKKINYYSNNEFTKYIYNLSSQNVATFNWSDTGCFIWNERDLPDLSNSAVSFCLEATENCNTIFPYNSTELVLKFMETVNTDQKLKMNVGIDNKYILNNVTLETDNTAPDISLIDGDFLSADENAVYIQVTNMINQRIICHYKEANRIAMNEITVEDIVGHSTIYLEANETRADVVVPLEMEGFTEKMYAVMVVCMNNPGASYSSHYTIPFPLVVFYNKRGIIPLEYEPMEPSKCDSTENSFKQPECLVEIPGSEIPEYIGLYKKENNTEDKDLFYLLPNSHQIQLLEDELDFLALATDLVSYFDDITYVGELLGERQCQYTSNFFLCRIHKQSVYQQMFSHFTNSFSTDNYLTNLRFTSVNKVRTVKAFAETIFYLTNNQDSIANLKQIEFLFEFLEAIKIPELLDFSEAGLSDRVDIVRVLVASALNLHGILIYASADFIIDESVERGIIKNNNYIIRQKNLVNSYLRQFWELGETSFSYKTFNFYLHTKTDNPAQSRQNRILYEDDWTINVQFNAPNITVQFRHALLQKYQGHYVHVYSYKHYPFVNMGTDLIYPNFVGIEMYGEQGNYINVQDINEEFAVNITYNDISNINLSVKDCLIFDEKEMAVSAENVKYERASKSAIRCKLSQFADVSLGDIEKLEGDDKDSLLPIIILVILAIALLVVVGYAIVLFIRKKTSKIIPEQIPNSSPLMQEI